jgi:hypothetical protein
MPVSAGMSQAHRKELLLTILSLLISFAELVDVLIAAAG